MRRTGGPRVRRDGRVSLERKRRPRGSEPRGRTVDRESSRRGGRASRETGAPWERRASGFIRARGTRGVRAVRARQGRGTGRSARTERPRTRCRARAAPERTRLRRTVASSVCDRPRPTRPGEPVTVACHRPSRGVAAAAEGWGVAGRIGPSLHRGSDPSIPRGFRRSFPTPKSGCVLPVARVRAEPPVVSGRRRRTLLARLVNRTRSIMRSVCHPRRSHRFSRKP